MYLFDCKLKFKTFLLLLLMAPVFFPLLQEFKKHQIAIYLKHQVSALSTEEIRGFTSWLNKYFVDEGILENFEFNKLGKGTSIIELSESIPFVIDELKFNAAYDPALDILYIDEDILKYALEYGLADSVGANLPVFSHEGEGEARIRRNLLSFILLHELGHKQLHSSYHQMCPSVSRSDNNKALASLSSEDQKMEMEADSFALQKLRTLTGVNDSLSWQQLYFNVYSLIFLNMMPQITAESSTPVSLSAYSHPSMLHRCGRLFRLISEQSDDLSVGDAAEVHAYAFENTLNFVLSEIPPGIVNNVSDDLVKHALFQNDTLTLIYNSGNIGFIDFSIYAQKDIEWTLREQRVLEPIITENNTHEDIQYTISSHRIYGIREHIWQWGDTIYLLAPSWPNYDEETYTLRIAYRGNNWKWKKIKDFYGISESGLTNLILLREERKVVIYLDDENNRNTFFFVLALQGDSNQAFKFKSENLDSTIKTDDIQIYWSQPVEKKIYQFITARRDSQHLESYVFRWDFTGEVEKQLMFKIDSTQKIVPTHLEYYAKKKLFVGVEQNNDLDSVTIVEYSQSGNIVNQAIYSALWPPFQLNLQNTHNMWTSDFFDPTEIGQVIVLQDSQKLLLEIGTVLIVDLDSLEPLGVDMFMMPEEIALELEKYQLFISRLAGSYNLAIYPSDFQ